VVSRQTFRHIEFSVISAALQPLNGWQRAQLARARKRAVHWQVDMNKIYIT
jgi:hypothetical protein